MGHSGRSGGHFMSVVRKSKTLYVDPAKFGGQIKYLKHVKLILARSERNRELQKELAKPYVKMGRPEGVCVCDGRNERCVFCGGSGTLNR